MSWTFGYQALQLSNVVKAGTVDKLSVVFAILLAILFLKERPSALNWAGVGLVLVGVYCIAHQARKPDAAKDHRQLKQASIAGGQERADPPERPGLTSIGPGPASAPDPSSINA